MKIGVVAASSRFDRATAERVTALVAAERPGVELVFHPNSFLEAGHFAGDDAARAAAVLDFANDPDIGAVWFARGGYGSCRIADAVAEGLTAPALDKPWLGYSDAGSLLSLVHRLGGRHVAHGPMPGDINRPGGEAAVLRGLDWLTHREPTALEPGLDATPALAFNLTILCALMGTRYEPEMAGRVLLLEEVSEMHYRIDRALFHLTSQPSFRRLAGVRAGRFSDIPDNDPAFESEPKTMIADWCARAGVAWLGTADIGHDVDNKVVPFG